MPRFYLPPDAWQSGILAGDEARHLAQVLRLKRGDTITVFDGRGRRAEADVLNASRHEVTLQLHESSTVPPPLPAITLAQAIPKGKTMDLIVQKAVELGVASIQPLITKNTVVQPDEGKSDKWRRTAMEACKQCGQDTLPQIADPLPFDLWLKSGAGVPPAAHHLKIIASLAPGAAPLRELLHAHSDHPCAATLLVGPEGDFTPQETASALDAGFLPASLGEIVLRVETATLFCLSVLKYEFG